MGWLSDLQLETGKTTGGDDVEKWKVVVIIVVAVILLMGFSYFLGRSGGVKAERSNYRDTLEQVEALGEVVDGFEEANRAFQDTLGIFSERIANIVDISIELRSRSVDNLAAISELAGGIRRLVGSISDVGAVLDGAGSAATELEESIGAVIRDAESQAAPTDN